MHEGGGGHKIGPLLTEVHSVPTHRKKSLGASPSNPPTYNWDSGSYFQLASTRDSLALSKNHSRSLSGEDSSSHIMGIEKEILGLNH